MVGVGPVVPHRRTISDSVTGPIPRLLTILALLFLRTTIVDAALPPAAILFVHGLCSDSSIWDKTINDLNLVPIRSATIHLFADGNIVRVRQGYLNEWLAHDAPDSNDVFRSASDSNRIFTIDFYNEQVGGFAKEYVNDTGIINKAFEFKRVIAEVKRISGLETVIVIGHSMGGLVARAYVEGLVGPYGHDVAGIVTLNTPHQGSGFANWYVMGGNCFIENSVDKLDLQPGSDVLQRLNGRDIPDKVAIISVVSEAVFGAGDGVVSSESQNLKSLARYSSARNVVEEYNRVSDVPSFPLHASVYREANTINVLGRLTRSLWPTRIALDLPSGQVGAAALGQGWAFKCHGFVPTLELFVGGQPLSLLFKTDVPRPDVFAAYSRECDSVSGDTGFTFLLDIDSQKVATGEHSVEVRVTDDVGRVTRSNSQKIQVGPVSPAARYEGYHEQSGCDTIRGWAWDARQPNTPISVKIYDGTTALATVLANGFRQDLKDAGYGDGRHGFSQSVPASLKDGKVHTIVVKFADTDTSLPPVASTSRTLSCSGDSNPPFGHLDAPGAGTILANVTNVGGWVLDNEDASLSVELLLDGKSIAGTPARGARSDVCQAHPAVAHCLSSQPGFAFPWDTKTVSNGSHTLAIRVTDPGALPTTFGERIVSVKNDTGTPVPTPTPTPSPGPTPTPGPSPTPTPDFSVLANPTTNSIVRGNSTTITLTVKSIDGFNSAVSFSATGLPTGYVVSGTSWTPATAIPPANGTTSSTLTIATDGNTKIGTSTTTLRATAGALTRDASVTITITEPVPGDPAPCTVSVSNTSQSFTSAGGTGTIGVSTSRSDCTWTATSDTSWLAITGGSSGKGAGVVSFSVPNYTAAGTRTGRLTVADHTFEVTQTGPPTPPPCESYGLFPDTKVFGVVGGKETTKVVALPVGCAGAWTAQSNDTWITVSDSSGNGDGAITIVAAANPDTTVRQGTATIAGKSFTVKQAGLDPPINCTYSLSPSSQTVPAGGGNPLGVGVTVSPTTCTESWTATSNATWIKLSSVEVQSGSRQMYFEVDANITTESRQGTLTLAKQTHTVSQSDSCKYSISPTSQSIEVTGLEDFGGRINVTTQDRCPWEATSDVNWIVVSPAASPGTGSGQARFSVLANPATSSRSGTLTIRGQVFTATQDGKK